MVRHAPYILNIEFKKARKRIGSSRAFLPFLGAKMIQNRTVAKNGEYDKPQARLRHF